MSQKEAFLAALDFVLASEGGLIDHPADPGGITYAGISLRAVVGLKDENGQLEFDLDHDGDVDADDIRMLAVLGDSTGGRKLKESFYRRYYWKRAQCDLMPWPISLLVFDAAVNHGPRPAVLMLQRALRVTADGITGEETLHAVAEAQPDAWRRYLVERGFLYYQLSVRQGLRDAKPSFGEADAKDVIEATPFYRGWLKRLFDLQAECLRPVRQ